MDAYILAFNTLAKADVNQAIEQAIAGINTRLDSMDRTKVK
tara:strand:+ start:5806 stop:5928 length:123 start_codon:yes stop_codon:yes gene_type:complete